MMPPNKVPKFGDDAQDLGENRTLRQQKYFDGLLKNENKDYLKTVSKSQTPGDSFGFDASNKLLKKKFNNYKFVSLEEGIKKYFKWINSVPKIKNLKKFHPLKQK